MINILKKGSIEGSEVFDSEEEMNTFFLDHNKEDYFILGYEFNKNNIQKQYDYLTTAKKIPIESDKNEYYINASMEVFSKTKLNGFVIKIEADRIDINRNKYTRNELYKKYYLGEI